MLKNKEIESLHRESEELRHLTRSSTELAESQNKELERMREEIKFLRGKNEEYEQRLRDDKSDLDKTLNKYSHSNSETHTKMSEYEALVYSLEMRLAESDREKAMLEERLEKVLILKMGCEIYFILLLLFYLRNGIFTFKHKLKLSSRRSASLVS